MIKARKLMIPKIYVPNSNIISENSSSSGLISQSALSSSQKGSLGTPKHFATNPEHITNLDSRINQVDPKE